MQEYTKHKDVRATKKKQLQLAMYVGIVS